MMRAAWLIIVALPGQLAAQTWSDSSLALAVRLVSEGQGDSARSIVRARLASLNRTDSLYPEALFAAGSVAEHLDSALSAYRRLSIEYAQSPWADDALLRVATLSFAARDLATVRRSTDRILLDYPASDVRAAAAYFAARVRLDENQESEACPLLQQAVDEAGTDIELANRARYYLQRCRVTPPPVTTDTTATRTSAPAVPAVPATPRSLYAVQVAAVGTAAAADEHMRLLAAAGYQPRVVREGALFKVRVGEYATRPEAQTLQAEIRRKMGGQPFVVEERR